MDHYFVAKAAVDAAKKIPDPKEAVTLSSAISFTVNNKADFAKLQSDAAKEAIAEVLAADLGIPSDKVKNMIKGIRLWSPCLFLGSCLAKTKLTGHCKILSGPGLASIFFLSRGCP